MKHRRTATVQRILGFLIAGASLMMIPPALVSWWYEDGTADLFLVSAVILFLVGMAIFLPVRHVREELRLRDGFLVVVACWLSLVLVGALPFLLLMQPEISYVDAVFESMSGLTTTGATILTNIDACHVACCITVSNFNGWAVSALWYWPSPFCLCSVLVVCNFTGQKRRVR